MAAVRSLPFLMKLQNHNIADVQFSVGIEGNSAFAQIGTVPASVFPQEIRS